MSFAHLAEYAWYRIGQREGLLKGVEVGLKMKFGAEGLALLDALRRVNEPTRLQELLQTLRHDISLDDFRQRVAAKLPYGPNGE